MADRRGGGAGGQGGARPGALLTVPEVAERLRVSPETVRRYLRRGWLTGVVLGGRSTGYRIEPEELERFLSASRGATVTQVAEERARYDAARAGEGKAPAAAA